MEPVQYLCKAPGTINNLFHFLLQVSMNVCVTLHTNGTANDRCGSVYTETGRALPSFRQHCFQQQESALSSVPVPGI